MSALPSTYDSIVDRLERIADRDAVVSNVTLALCMTRALVALANETAALRESVDRIGLSADELAASAAACNRLRGGSR